MNWLFRLLKTSHYKTNLKTFNTFDSHNKYKIELRYDIEQGKTERVVNDITAKNEVEAVESMVNFWCFESDLKLGLRSVVEVNVLSVTKYYTK